jgi:hypothetical protein
MPELSVLRRPIEGRTDIRPDDWRIALDGDCFDEIGRTALADWPRPERKRHLVRVWLRDHGRLAHPR